MKFTPVTSYEKSRSRMNLHQSVHARWCMAFSPRYVTVHLHKTYFWKNFQVFVMQNPVGIQLEIITRFVEKCILYLIVGKILKKKLDKFTHHITTEQTLLLTQFSLKPFVVDQLYWLVVPVQCISHENSHTNICKTGKV